MVLVCSEPLGLLFDWEFDCCGGAVFSCDVVVGTWLMV
jgi:hypothetical protein